MFSIARDGDHESGGLLAFPRRYRSPSRCSDLLRILGIDWRASMGEIEADNETMSSSIPRKTADQSKHTLGLLESIGRRQRRDNGYWKVTVPHWFIILPAAAASFAVRPAPRLKFTTRELLITVTIAAVELGTIVATIPRD
jgi:hypothetical protein